MADFDDGYREGCRETVEKVAAVVDGYILTISESLALITVAHAERRCEAVQGMLNDLGIHIQLFLFGLGELRAEMMEERHG